MAKTNELPKEIYGWMSDEWGDDDEPFNLDTFTTLLGAAEVEERVIGVYRLVEVRKVRLVVSQKIEQEKVE